ncbi:Synaptotagmin-7 [Trichinella spiralis]|uniref:Synaptotagmin-7 n=1 Tax=Trichinella spiralis TaxID=6334 RepID=A0A0V1BFA8_TRISP|nr:Synaptotagmin-7 [Trichinella spiralis]
MEALILQSLLGRESGRKKPSTGNAINNAQQRNFHLPCRGQRAIFSPPAVRLRNQTTPTGRPNKDRQEVPDKYLHQRSVADRLIYPFSSLDIDSELVNWRLLQGASNVSRIEGEKGFCSVVFFFQCRCGELKIGLCYESTLSTLRVFVVEARNLPYADFGISSKPYVRLWLVQFGNCLDRRKTRPKSRSHSPIFREQFIFTVPLAKLPIVKLVLASLGKFPKPKPKRSDRWIWKIYHHRSRLSKALSLGGHLTCSFALKKNFFLHQQLNYAGTVSQDGQIFTVSSAHIIPIGKSDKMPDCYTFITNTDCKSSKEGGGGEWRDVCMDPPIGLDDEVGHIILERQSKGAEGRHWEMMIQNQDETLEMWHKLKKEWC